jgi:hypothetical protein
MQHGSDRTLWLGTLGQAPIVESWALQSCAPGTLTVARWDTPAGAPDFCVGTATSTQTLTLNSCVPDPLGEGEEAGGYAKLVDNTCLTDQDDELFFVANMYYSPTCTLPTFVFRATYMASDAGECELAQIPQFLDGTPTKRAIANYSTLFGGGYKINWYDSSDTTCAPNTLVQSFTQLQVGVCSQSECPRRKRGGNDAGRPHSVR